MSNYNFKKDLEEGKKMERWAVDFLTTHGLDAQLIPYIKDPNNPHPADIAIGCVRLDVKHEKYSAKSGKIFIEVACLQKTDADFLMYLTDYDNFVHMVPVWGLLGRLKRLHSELGNERIRYMPNAGDSRFQKNREANPGYIVSIEDLTELDIKITKEEFMAYVENSNV